MLLVIKRSWRRWHPWCQTTECRTSLGMLHNVQACSLINPWKSLSSNVKNRGLIVLNSSEICIRRDSKWERQPEENAWTRSDNPVAPSSLRCRRFRSRRYWAHAAACLEVKSKFVKARNRRVGSVLFVGKRRTGIGRLPLMWGLAQCLSISRSRLGRETMTFPSSWLISVWSVGVLV